MGFFSFFGSLMIGGVIGYVSEKWGLTNNGYLQSIIICLGGVVLFFMIRTMFGFGFGSPGLDAIVSSAGALVIVPTARRKK
ncbi:MAG: hypothetical protein ACTSRN_05890 [Alphaproteobacteria bacterium]